MGLLNKLKGTDDFINTSISDLRSRFVEENSVCHVIGLGVYHIVRSTDADDGEETIKPANDDLRAKLVSSSSTGTGLLDAPIDGLGYGRKDEAWVEVALKTDIEITSQSVSTPTAIHVLTDTLIVYDTALNDGTVNLLAASLWNGKSLQIKKTKSANKVSINPDGSELIDGIASFDFFNMNESITIMSDGTGIVIV